MKIETRCRKEKEIEILMGRDKVEGGTEGEREICGRKEKYMRGEREICGRKEKYMRGEREICGRKEKYMRGEREKLKGTVENKVPNKFYYSLFFYIHGYITLGHEGNGRHMNYYFATLECSSSEDPVVFWTTDGSGCSGMNAIIYFHGPFKIDEDPDYIINGVKVELNPFRWTKVSSLVVMDAPVGTGFSYSDNSEDYQTDDSKTIADQYDFGLKWFREYPEFLSNPYITGCSYAGAYIPTLSLEIEDLRISCQGNYWNSIHLDCLRNMEAFKKVITRNAEESVQMYYGCDENGYDADSLGTNDVGVSENANGYHHIREIYCYVEVAGRWKRCSDRLNYQKEKIGLIQHHLNLTLKGSRAIIYTGDHDMAAPYTGALEWIWLNYTELESWRPWFIGHKYKRFEQFISFSFHVGDMVSTLTPYVSLLSLKTNLYLH
ncbi:hypothetical protein AMTRI_Chr06g197860 [Amborella trichopoda]